MNTPQKSCALCYLCAKNFRNRSKFDNVLTKNKFAQFFLRHSVDIEMDQYAGNAGEVSGH